MSDFRERIKESANTLEQYEHSKQESNHNCQDNEANRAAATFCGYLRKNIQERAQKGRYITLGDRHIIKGYIYGYRDMDSGIEQYHSVDYIEDIRGNNLAFGLYDGEFVGKQVDKHFVSVYLEEHKKGGFFHTSDEFKCIQNFELSYTGKRFLHYISSSLNSDEIEILPIWVVTKFKPKKMHLTNKDNKFTLKKQWHEGYTVCLAFEFKFEF